MYRNTLILTLVIALVLVFSAGAHYVPDVETLCLQQYDTNNGEVIAWKGHINGAVKCKINDIVDPNAEFLCYPNRDANLWMNYEGQRWVNDDTVVCKYRRTNR